MTPAPRSGSTEKVQFRLPVHLIQKMDSRISDPDSEFSTRSEYLRHLVEADLSERDLLENLDITVASRIEEGRYDNALSTRISKIIATQLLKK